jgi:hypothetical protein
MKKVDLFGQGMNALSPTVNAQMRINCFYEIIKDGDKDKIIIRGTPGLQRVVTLPNNLPVRGVCVANNLLYVVAGFILYSINTSNNIIVIGSVSPGTAAIEMATNGISLIIVDGIAGWVYTFATNTLAKIGFGMVPGIITPGTLYTNGTFLNVPITGGTGTGATATIVVAGGGVTSVTFTLQGNGYHVSDLLSVSSASIGGTGSGFNVMVAQINSGFPNNANSVTFIDGYFIVNQVGSQQFFLSNLFDGSNWNALQFASKESSADNLIAVNNLNSTVILWGTNSIEFWQDAGTFPFPMQRMSGSTSSWGLAAKNSRASVGNTLMFLGQNSQGLMEVMILDGFSPKRVSTHDIEHLMSEFTTVVDAIALTYMIDGHIMYQLTFPSNNYSFLYDVTTDMWSRVQSGIAPARHDGAFGIVYNNQNYVTDWNTGDIYILNKYIFTDYDAQILREVDTRHLWSDGDVFTVNELWLDMDTGEGTQVGQGSNPTVMLQVSKDGGRTFGNIRTASIGKIGQYGGPRVVFRRFGSSRDFVFKITMTDPVSFIIIGASAVIKKANQG